MVCYLLDNSVAHVEIVSQDIPHFSRFDVGTRLLLYCCYDLLHFPNVVIVDVLLLDVRLDYVLALLLLTPLTLHLSDRHRTKPFISEQVVDDVSFHVEQLCSCNRTHSSCRDELYDVMKLVCT